MLSKYKDKIEKYEETLKSVIREESAKAEKIFTQLIQLKDEMATKDLQFNKKIIEVVNLRQTHSS